MSSTSVCLLGALLSCGAISAFAAPLELQECRLQSAMTRGAATARCGRFVVRENRDDSASRQLQIHVAVIPALRLRPQADALFIISGGPGQAATDFYLSTAPAFARVRRDRDLVLVDQRGTGRSGRLDCKLPQAVELGAVETDELRAAVRACLSAMPGDPRYYTTSVAVRDLDDIRAALGYESVSLYGVSYGTRVAQHYMRRYPQRVRTAVLDGVAPADLALGPDIALAAQDALDAVFARCAADADCNQAFPDLAQRFTDLRSRLQKQPVVVALADPRTAQPAQAVLGDGQLSAAVRMLSYSDETASILPLLIYEAQARERPEALAAQYLMIRNTLEQQLALGMHFSVVCSEDAPRWERERIDDAALAQTYIGVHLMNALRAVCEQWPRGPVDRDFWEPLTTSVPTLLLSGGDDPVTPARYAARILPGFAHARHLELAGQGHGQIGVGCMPRVVGEFIEEGSIETLEDACLNSVAPAPFMISNTAPAP